MSNSNLSLPAQRDEVQLFMLYALFGGDTARVSIVTGVPKQEVDALAQNFDWRNKVNGRQRLDTDEGKEVERQLNRVSTYVTAERLSRVFGNLISALDSDPDFARAFCTEIDEEGKKSFNTKNLVEIAKGLEIVANVKYRALGDKMAAEADTTGSGKSVSLTLNVFNALAKRFDNVPVVDTAAEVISAVSNGSVDGK